MTYEEVEQELLNAQLLSGCFETKYGTLTYLASRNVLISLSFTKDVFWPKALKPQPVRPGPLLKTSKFVLLGTDFQKEVWRTLLQIKEGETMSYGEIARRLYRPHAARAVGQAVGANPLAGLIPCHRVLAAGGAIGGFREGSELKRRLLASEGIFFK